MRIYKYRLTMSLDPQTIPMHRPGLICHVKEQDNLPTIWAVAYVSDQRTDGRTDDRTFQLFATGEDIPPNDTSYVGTVHLAWTVWHIFELTLQEHVS